jgi:hypothetical protein
MNVGKVCQRAGNRNTGNRGKLDSQGNRAECSNQNSRVCTVHEPSCKLCFLAKF